MEGKAYKGARTLERGMVTVKCYSADFHAPKVTQLGNTRPEALARLLLSEIAQGV
jgi:hypothetical protein